MGHLSFDVNVRRLTIIIFVAPGLYPSPRAPRLELQGAGEVERLAVGEEVARQRLREADPVHLHVHLAGSKQAGLKEGRDGTGVR